MGLVPVAYSVFAMALGIAAGALLRRTLPAIAVTLAGFIAVRALIALLLRPHYMSAVTVFYKVMRGFNAPPGSYWQVAQGVLGPDGQPVPQPNGSAVFGIPMSYLPASCAPLGRGDGGASVRTAASRGSLRPAHPRGAR